MNFGLEDSIDSIDKLLDRDGIEIEVYAWEMIKKHMMKQDEVIKDLKEKCDSLIGIAGKLSDHLIGDKE